MNSQQEDARHGVEAGHDEEDESGGDVERLGVDGVEYDDAEHHADHFHAGDRSEHGACRQTETSS